jgi:hypothetical protein
LRCVAVLREDQGSLRGRVDERRLVLRIDRRDGDGVDAFGEQIIDDTLLFCGRAVGGDPELGVDVRQSWAAFSTPRRAIVQKSEELLVTNASLSLLLPLDRLPSRDWHPAASKERQTT